MAEPIIADSTNESPAAPNPDRHTAIWACAGEIEGDAVTLESIQYVIASLIDEASEWAGRDDDRRQSPTQLFGALTTMNIFLDRQVRELNEHVVKLYATARATRSAA